jgi:hypothetical protein
VKQWLEQTYPNLFVRAKKLKATLYFADEASLRSDSHRGTTWGTIGQTPVVEEHTWPIWDQLYFRYQRQGRNAV